MKHNLILLLFILCNVASALGQVAPPPPADVPGSPPPPVGLPISDYIPVLLIAGLFYGFYTALKRKSDPVN